MRKTVAVRVDEEMGRALEERAAVSGMTVSEVVRDALREALAERPLSARIGHLSGALAVRSEEDPWQSALRERNWRW